MVVDTINVSYCSTIHQKSFGQLSHSQPLFPTDGETR